MVLVAVIGSTAAEKSGFLVALMERFLGKSKGWVVTAVIMFLGINLNIACDAGFVVLPPLAAILYMSIGCHPLLGMYAGYAFVAAGFCANIAIGLSDALVYGYTANCDYYFGPGPLINEDKHLVDIAQSVVKQILVEDALVPVTKMLGAEDFSVYLEHIPGVYRYLGFKNPNKEACSHNNADFMVDESVLPYGAGIYVQFAFDFLENK